MSKAPTENLSDDEFQDALSEVPKTNSNTDKEKSTEQIVEEIIEQQMSNTSLNDDTNDTFEDAAQTFGKPVIEEITEDNEKAEYIEEMINEEELKELEKSKSIEELEANKEKANKLKLEANELFKNDEAEQAIAIYCEALKLCPTIYPKDRAILYGNRAAAKIKLDLKKSALDDCTEAIKLWPEYARALLRRAKLYELDDKLDLALDDFKRVHELDPRQQEAREACIRLPPIVNERNEKLKEECLDKLKDLGNMILRPFGLSTANFQMQQDPNSGGYTINFNQNAS